MKMKDMRRWIACLAVVLLCMQTAVADEGMWLINRLGEIYPQMKSTVSYTHLTLPTILLV